MDFFKRKIYGSSEKKCGKCWEEIALKCVFAPQKWKDTYTRPVPFVQLESLGYPEGGFMDGSCVSGVRRRKTASKLR